MALQELETQTPEVITEIDTRELIRPKRLEVDERSLTPTFGKFSGEPFERGFGTTIGNGVRRVMLSSLEGAAIVAVRVKSVLHEFSTIPGVLEDVTDIVLNLKEIRVKLHDGVTEETARIQVRGERIVTAADIQAGPQVEIMNPHQHIASVAKDAELDLELVIRTGRGYVPAERNKRESDPVGTIPLDAVFSPIVKVNFTVTNSRVGQRTDYDRLTLTVETNGTMSPEESVSYAAALAQTHFQYFVGFGSSASAQPGAAGDGANSDALRLAELFRTPIDDLELSVRSVNSLKNSNIRSLGDLVRQTEAQILQVKNFGKKSLQEIAALLEKEGLNFGMRYEESVDGVRILDMGTAPSRAAENAPDDDDDED
jgi:DNA-directed RNA polymerase subunit alpha